MSGEELPAGMFRLADGDPGFADDVDVFAEAFDFFGLKKERIVRDQERGVGFADDFYGAVGVVEKAVAGVDVVVGVIGVEVLIFEVVVNVAGSDDVGGGVVVLDVVGGEAGLAVDDDDVAIGDVEVALAALRTAGGDFRELPLGAGKMRGLLGTGCRRLRARE